MRHTLILILLLSLFAKEVAAQLPVPENGVKKSRPELVALKNAKIIVSPEKTIDKGVLLIADGRVQAVGALVNIPKNAVVIDVKGKTIVPSFIESFSHVGLPEPEKGGWSPRPQLESNKEGPYYWNESIQPEINAAEHFKVSAKESKKLQEMGFGVAITHRQDGIMRGTGAAVALGDLNNNEAVLKAHAAAFFSFQKGSSKQSYPSSQMGSIALMRQAFYDALYYDQNKEQLRANLSLEAINSNKSLPKVIDVSDKLEVLRAQKIAEEFGFNFTVIGGGNEYERIDKLKGTNLRLIVPIDFPEAYEVSDPYVARQIPLSDLKHWELAPVNPYFLAKNGVKFALTSKGHSKPADFWKHLHQALEKGLSSKDALAALTTVPAEIFGLQQVGTLEEGNHASFSIFNLDPFEYKEAKVEESWSLGYQHVLREINDVDMRGTYNLTLEGKVTYPIEIKGTIEKPTAKLTALATKTDSVGKSAKDTLHPKVNLTVKGTDVSIHFNVKDDHFNGAITLHGKFNPNVGIIEGQGALDDGRWVKWAAIKNKKADKDDTPEKIITDSVPSSRIWFPNMAYGFDTLPAKKIYVIRNATLWTNEKEGIVKDATLMIKDGKIDFVGRGTHVIPANAIEINAAGMHVTSGIIDEHSHIAISKGVNESGQSNSAEVSIGDVVRSDDINIYRQLSGGVTAAQLLHGSANAIGGQSALVKLKWGSAPEDMKIKDAPKFIKFALGENVKQSNWGDYQTIRFPQTRMGVEQVFYDAFMRAQKYHEEWEAYNATSQRQRNKENILPPARDLELETVWEIMNGERFISCHSYVQSEINMLMHVADSMGFTVNTFTHILEGYKLADKMLKHGAGASTFSDWWGYKFEVNDAIPYNAALMNEEGLVVAINSDDAEMGRRLNQEAAKAVKYGSASEEDAWKMVTLNPAKLLHLDDRMGSLKVGKDADVVIWTDNPLSINAKVATVFIDGVKLYDYKQDELKRLRNQREKARIVNLMLSDNKQGNPSKTFVKKKEKHWHCDTIGEHGEESHSHE